MCFFMFKKIREKINSKWTLYLFYNGCLIKKVRIDENTTVKDLVLDIKVYGHKALFGKNIITLMVKPTKLLKTNLDKRKTYWGVVFEKGVDIQ